MKILSAPCLACPYRKDVASGLWDASEYEKLPPYDRATNEQPFEPFACHAVTDALCHGWAVCHSTRGHDKELIALRLLGIGFNDIPNPGVPLFESGTEAAIHGKRDILMPKKQARAVMAKLQARYPRLK